MVQDIGSEVKFTNLSKLLVLENVIQIAYKGGISNSLAFMKLYDWTTALLLYHVQRV